ncbi:glycosyltransferase family 2 protein [Amylibacter sp.]|nr:glycosyltransferase family 2 protein [Amylibacter sp.]
MTKTIPVSVAVPAFNCDKTIEKCISSINCGSQIPNEIIVSYDKSTDKTFEKLTNLLTHYDNVVIVINDLPNGAAANRNNALAQCKNEVLTHVDADDTICKLKLEKEFCQIINGQKVAFSDYQIVSNSFKPGCRVAFKRLSLEMINNTLKVDDFLNRTYGVPRDLMFLRETWKAVGSFDTQMKMYEDLDFKIRLFLRDKNWAYTGVAGTNYIQDQRSLSRSCSVLKTQSMSDLKSKYVLKNSSLKRCSASLIEKSVSGYYLTKFGIKS